MKKIFAGLFLILTCAIGNAQVTSPDAKIPVDPDIIKGRLDNGLTYYVKANKQPENRVEMRLVVNVGSIVEDEDQLGLAHFLEHMCFNGTKNFEKQEIINFLEKTGVKFGPDLNAYTSFDETVYYFQIPSERLSLVDTGLTILYEWANNVTFEEEEVDKERGVVIEEWRLGLGAQDRMLKQFLPVALKGSRYEKRLPIGEKDIIENFEYDVLKRFYKDWYRPDLMAVIVVGDIDKNRIEQLIKEKFSKMENPESPRERVFYSIPNNQEPLISIVTDKEARYTEVDLYYKHDKKPEGTVGVYKEFIMRQLYNGIMSIRLNEILQKPDAPFIYAATRYSGFLGRTKDAYSSMAISKENQINSSLERLIIENERVKQHGFTAGELDRQKKEIIAFYQSALKEKGKTESNAYASEFTRNFLTNEPIPGIEKEYEYVEHFLPKIDLHDLNQLANQWIVDSNLVVIITGPEKEGASYPTKEAVAQTIGQTTASPVAAYVDQVDDSPLMKKMPKKGKIVAEKYDKNLDYHTFELSNGTKVIAKKTNFKNDEVLMSAFSYGGGSLYGNEDIYTLMFADVIAQNSGVGNNNIISLMKKMAGSTANIDFSINKYSEGISGSCSPKDLEDLFKLHYLYFMEPRSDNEAFESIVSRIENQFLNMKSDPRSMFSDTLKKVVTSNDPRAKHILEPSDIDQISQERSLEIFDERFSDPADFTYVFVGNIPIDTLKTLLTQYLASIPSKNIKELYKNIEPEFPEGITKLNFYKGIDPQALVYVIMNDDFLWEEDEKLYTHFLSKVLSIRLREKVREDQGGTYGVRVNLSIGDVPEPNYNLSIGFGCSPEKTDTLFNMVVEELKAIMEDGPTDDEMQKVKEIYIRDRETSMKTNSFWLSSLQNMMVKQEPIFLFDAFKERIQSVKKENIKDVAVKYIDLNNYVHAVMLPENMKP
jgi:zinc protease